MGAATFKVILGPRPKSDGTRAVVLRITKNRVVRFVPTGIWLDPKLFNPKATPQKAEWVRGGHHQRVEFNKSLVRTFRATWARALERPDDSADVLAAYARAVATGAAEPGAGDFFEFAESQAAACPVHATGRLMRESLRHLRRWHGAGPLAPQQLTRPRVQDFQAWLAHRGTAPNSQATKLRYVALLYRRAVVAGHVPPGTADPFYRYPMPKAPVRKVPLTALELAAVREVALPNPKDALARDFWLTQFYLFGARSADVLLLTWPQISAGRVGITMQKTGKLVDVPISAPLAALLESQRRPGAVRVFPFVPDRYATAPPAEQRKMIEHGRQFVNRHLKAVAAAASIGKPLTTHVARHTLAALADRATGGDTRAVQQMLGHSTIRTTEVYLAALDSSVTDAAAAAVYGATTAQ